MSSSEQVFDVSIEIAKRLNQLRKEKGLSLEKLSEEVTKHGGSLSHDSLLNYEAASTEHSKYGKNLAMRIDNLIVLAKMYNVSTDYLLCLSDVRNPDPSIKAAVEYTGLAEESILLMHLLSGFRPKKENLEVARMYAVSEIIDTLNFLDKGACKVIISLIDKMLATIGDNLIEVVDLYNEIEYSEQRLMEQHKDKSSVFDFIDPEQQRKLDEHGFRIVDVSWIAKKSWEQLLNILQTGIQNEITEAYLNGKRTKRYSVNISYRLDIYGQKKLMRRVRDRLERKR